MTRKLILIVLAAALAACGYKVSGRYDGLPEHIRSIAVPTFANQTLRSGLEQALTAAVKKEFQQRGRYAITADPAAADAVLGVTIRSYAITPIGIKEQNVGTVFLVTIVLDIQFTDRREDKILYKADGFVVREEYALSDRTVNFYIEDDPAVQRAAQAFAASLVPTLLETF
jgi:outer membrane lipopolysaccharide assembly protein LptE/RlpB